MNLINRKSKELVLHGGRAKTRLYVSLNRNHIYFTSSVSRLCEMQVGLYVHFMNEGSDWNFYLNDDTDGFKLCFIKSKGGYMIANTGLTQMMLKSFGVKDEKRLSIEPTNIMQDKCPVFKLSFDEVSNVIR